MHNITQRSFTAYPNRKIAQNTQSWSTTPHNSVVIPLLPSMIAFKVVDHVGYTDWPKSQLGEIIKLHACTHARTHTEHNITHRTRLSFPFHLSERSEIQWTSCPHQCGQFWRIWGSTSLGLQSWKKRRYNTRLSHWASTANTTEHCTYCSSLLVHKGSLTMLHLQAKVGLKQLDLRCEILPLTW